VNAPVTLGGTPVACVVTIPAVIGVSGITFSCIADAKSSFKTAMHENVMIWGLFYSRFRAQPFQTAKIERLCTKT